MESGSTAGGDLAERTRLRMLSSPVASPLGISWTRHPDEYALRSVFYRASLSAGDAGWYRQGASVA